MSAESVFPTVMAKRPPQTSSPLENSGLKESGSSLNPGGECELPEKEPKRVLCKGQSPQCPGRAAVASWRLEGRMTLGIVHKGLEMNLEKTGVTTKDFTDCTS